MTELTYSPLDTATVEALRAGGLDAYGNAAERSTSSGAGNPCRHCLCNIPQDTGMLILAHRPFEGQHPYAETGPIFLCEAACTAHSGTEVPAILTTSPNYLLKAYTADERIHYGTGKIVDAADVSIYAAQLLDDPDNAFVDVRSARNNCFQLRIKRA